MGSGSARVASWPASWQVDLHRATPGTPRVRLVVLVRTQACPFASAAPTPSGSALFSQRRSPAHGLEHDKHWPTASTLT
eukprot:3482459-Rhodomonas_salina.1